MVTAHRDYGKQKTTGGAVSTDYKKLTTTKFADGGEISDSDTASFKDAGMKSSADDKVGFWDRLKAGNIDQKGSDAYNRWGAGKGISDSLAMSEDNFRGRDSAPAADTSSKKADDTSDAPAPTAVTMPSRPVSPTPKQTSAPAAAEPAKRAVTSFKAAPADKPASPKATTLSEPDQTTQSGRDKAQYKTFKNSPLAKLGRSMLGTGDITGARKGNQSNRYYGLNSKAGAGRGVVNPDQKLTDGGIVGKSGGKEVKPKAFKNGGKVGKC